MDGRSLEGDGKDDSAEVPAGAEDAEINADSLQEIDFDDGEVKSIIITFTMLTFHFRGPDESVPTCSSQCRNSYQLG